MSVADRTTTDSRPRTARRLYRSHRFARAMFVITILLASIAASSGAVLAQTSSTGDTLQYVTYRNLQSDVIYGVALGLLYAGFDQARNYPAEWGHGGSGFGKRIASNVGGFLIQEGVTSGLSIAMHRPVRYARCRCTGTANRLGWALSTGFSDPMPDGSRAIAVPRIAGAFIGSAAQAAWRPQTAGGRVANALAVGGSSLLIGAGINVIHEFWWPWGKKDQAKH